MQAAAVLVIQARLAADILKCGRKRVWLDPNEVGDIKAANSRKAVRRLIKDGFILAKPKKVSTRARWRTMKEAKAMGRHVGKGCREGTREARMPSKEVWMRRIRILRRMLRITRRRRRSTATSTANFTARSRVTSSATSTT